MHHSRPGEIRSFTLSMFASVILSPGTTSAPTRVAPTRTRIARAAACFAVPVIGYPPWNDSGPRADRRRGPVVVSKRVRSVTGVHERRDREPVVGDAGLLPLVEVPALLAGEARARERRLGRVLELHVDHDDGGDEPALVRILDGVRALERLLPERHVVDPDLPELTRAVVTVRERDDPRFLVDEDDPLPVGVLGKLGNPLDDVDATLLPALVERPVDLLVPFHRVVLRVVHAEQVALAEVLEVHPGDVAAVAVVAVDVGVLPEQRVGALRRRETP